MDRAARANVWFHGLCAHKEHPLPSVVLSIWGNFMSILGRRVRTLSLSDSQQRVALSWAVEYRAARPILGLRRVLVAGMPQ